jgi:hypothetical protein
MRGAYTMEYNSRKLGSCGLLLVYIGNTRTSVIADCLREKLMGMRGGRGSDKDEEGINRGIHRALIELIHSDIIIILSCFSGHVRPIVPNPVPSWRMLKHWYVHYLESSFWRRHNNFPC